MEIKYVGIRNLDEFENSKLKSIAERSYPKLGHLLKNPVLQIAIKKYNEAGKRCKISLHARVAAPNLRFSSGADDWEISKAAHKIFDKLEKEIEHKIGSRSSSKERKYPAVEL